MKARTTTIQRAVAALQTSGGTLAARPVSWIGSGRALVLHAGAFMAPPMCRFYALTAANVMERWQVAPAAAFVDETPSTPVVSGPERKRRGSRGRPLGRDLEASNPGLVSVTTVAERFGVTGATIRRRAAAAGVQLVRVSGNFMVPAEAADQLAAYPSARPSTTPPAPSEQPAADSEPPAGDPSLAWY